MSMVLVLGLTASPSRYFSPGVETTGAFPTTQTVGCAALRAWEQI